MDKFLNMKTFDICWNCGKEHDSTNQSPFEYGVKCECGGYVVSPSGKVQIKTVPIVHVYQMNEYDAVAAESVEQAIEYYSQFEPLDEEDIENIEVVPMDYQVWDDEERTKKISIREIIENEWKGEPFIAFSTEY
ncbi:hypothetical protein JK635_02390 [Neobacillus sp. YIM B02564]|uniref:Phage protein n=1 Tax=Neobacillus paridis TaxID=2803862 RepID=A0ABS1TK03_9BACI|nr:hypothetical protein [Neobacillus paridis]MBL4951089.1 hypothetical protein [Neobacillus paridis]